ncbi:AAA domain-containing protein [Arthrobacter sp.]|uniref:AAA domain-containing protein n=1 Tax=Arthrobacter sp. TaxID=1667 RepID=UPI003A8FA634
MKSRHGGHSSVRKAIELHTGDPVAIKFIVGRGNEMTESIFNREVKVLETARHHNIVSLLSSGIDDTQTPYLVMPWVESNLQEWIDEGNIADVRESIESLLLPLASAVAHLHRLRLEHRDLKPLNVLMTSTGEPLLADMSISKQTMATSAGLTMQNWRTPPFAPPEHIDKRPYVRDVYSLAALFVVAVSGRKITEHTELIAALDSIQCPSEVRNVLEQCLEMNPDARPADCSVLESELIRAHSQARERDLVRPLVHFVLTKTAHQTLEKALPDERSAAVFVAQDLNECAVARLTVGPDGLPMVELAGNQGLYRCSPKNQEGILLITQVSMEDLDSLEWLRRAGKPISTDTELSNKTAVNRERAVAGLAGFLTDLRSHNDNRDAPASQNDLTAHLNRWTRSLDVAIEFERRKRQRLHFGSGLTDSRDLIVRLADTTEDELVGSEWILKSSKESPTGIHVEVIRHVDRTVTLRSGSGHPIRRFRTGVLEPNLGPTMVSLRRQMDALSSLRLGSSVNTHLADLLDGIPPQQLAPSPPSQGWFQPLDRAKQQAVETALANNPAMLVKGPPGTGKTRLIAEIVAQELKKDPTSRILIVSQTHVAVDNALERIAGLGVDRVVRLGKPNDERISKASRSLLLDTQIGDWVERARQRSEQHMDDLSHQAGIPAGSVRAAFILQRIAAIGDLIARQQEKYATSVMDEVESEASAAESSDLRIDIEAQNLLVEHLWQELDEFVPDATRLHEQKSPDELRDLSTSMIAVGQDGNRLLQLVELQADWLQRMPIDSSLVATFLADASVVGGTCLGFLGHTAAKDLDFDLCIVDEASKATATEALVPVSKSRRIILVGDPSQLPPMEEEASRDDDLLQDFGVTPEELSETLYDVLSELLPSGLVIELDEQYRMLPAIGDMVSECFYDSKLKSPGLDPDIDLSTLWQPLVWVSTSFRNDRFEQQDKSSHRSFANRLEAREIAGLLAVLQRSIDKGLVSQDASKLEILVIAPYRSQLETIRRELAQIQVDFNVSVESIDAVQGKEADLTFFSVTRSNKIQNFGFIGKKYWRRINVAVSRSRLGLVIVGDLDFAKSVDGPLRQIATYLQQHSESAEVRDIE